jgi:hypothetical protein
MNTRMTQRQLRESIFTEIKSAYREILAAEKRVGGGKLTDKKQQEWSLRLGDAVKRLHYAFGRLPEVQLSAVDMTDREFAKLLIEEPKSPRFLPEQTDFLAEANA